uniref:Uncharacterized protein n=1 Tax=Thermofilum pendens TaxID=2269 RepID=A0A7C4F7Z4_THEPE
MGFTAASMLARVESLEKLSYAKVTRLRLGDGQRKVEVEIPDRVLAEAGLTPGEGDLLEVEVRKELGDTRDWDIVMRGEVYLKRSNPPRVYVSLWGLQLVLEDPEALKNFDIGDKLYLFIRAKK